MPWSWDRWLDRLEEAAKTVGPIHGGDRCSFRLVQEVAHSDPPVRWQISLENGVIDVTREPTGVPDVLLTVEPGAAEKLASAAMTVPEAYLAGSLRVTGHLERLIPSMDVIVQLQQAVSVALEADDAIL